VDEDRFVRDVPVARSNKTDQLLRLRLHSGLRQSGTHLSDDETVAKMGHPDVGHPPGAVPFPHAGSLWFRDGTYPIQRYSQADRCVQCKDDGAGV
jgi:hypothetical protein